MVNGVPEGILIIATDQWLAKEKETYLMENIGADNLYYLRSLEYNTWKAVIEGTLRSVLGQGLIRLENLLLHNPQWNIRGVYITGVDVYHTLCIAAHTTHVAEIVRLPIAIFTDLHDTIAPII
jgi:hypothetical protein